MPPVSHRFCKRTPWVSKIVCSDIKTEESAGLKTWYCGHADAATLHMRLTQRKTPNGMEICAWKPALTSFVGSHLISKGGRLADISENMRIVLRPMYKTEVITGETA